MEAPFDVAEADRLLTTTRAVRKRLDFDRDVHDQVLFDCIDVAEQAPGGGGYASRRWIIVRDQQLKEDLAALYQRTAAPARAMRAKVADGELPSDIPSACRGNSNWYTGENVSNDRRVQSDPDYVVRAWQAVFAYLATDYRFIYE